jgi:hypothetical protein
MKKSLIWGAVFLAGALVGWATARATGSSAAPASQMSPPADKAPAWIRGSSDERFAQVERHLRGLDVAMAEVGYRYTELFFAVTDRNWDYAEYQLDKIELALKLAVERRPKRAASAETFLSEDWDAVKAGLRSRQPERAGESVRRLRTACMKCHVAEQVPFFTVQLPEQRQTSIRPPSE